MTETPFDNMVQGAEPAEGAPMPEDAPEEQHSQIQLANFTNQLDMASEDLMIPRLRLMQGLSTEVQDGTATPGKWVLTGFDAKDDLTVVPCLFARNRTLRDAEGNIQCKSLDSLQGVGNPGGECAKCVFNQWTDDPKTKGSRLPPACAFSYVYIVYVKEYETMALLEFRRTSITAGKTLNTFCAQRGLVNFAVKLKSSKQTGKKGTFYSMVVQPTQSDQALLDAARAFVGQ